LYKYSVNNNNNNNNINNNNNNNNNNKDLYQRECLLDVYLTSIRPSTQQSLTPITTWFNNKIINDYDMYQCPY